MKKNTRLGQILLEKGLLTADQLQIAVNEQMKRRQQLGALTAKESAETSLGEILIELGFIDRLQLKRGLNWQLLLRKMTIVVSLFAPLMPASYSAAATTSSVSSSQASSSKTSSFSLQSASATAADLTAPQAPATITAQTVLANKVQFTWAASTDNVGVTKYRIFRDQVQIATLSGTQTTYVDSKVVGSTSYTYGVSAGDDAGNWSPVKTLSVKTPAASSSSKSSAPSSAATSSKSSASVATSSTSSAAVSSSKSSTPSSAAASSSLKAASPSSTSSSSSGVDVTAPQMPATISADIVLANKVQFSWAPSTDNVGVAKYKIFRDQVQIATLSGTQTTYSDSKVVGNTAYVYGVSAGDAAGNWSPTKSLYVQTPVGSSSSSSSQASSAKSSSSSSAAPIGPFKVAGPVALKWTAPILRENGTALDITEIGGYELRYRESADRAYTYISINDAWKNYYNFTYLTGTYNFQVAAFDKNGLYSSFVDLAPQ